MMDIKYRILSVNHKEHSIEVRYYTDLFSEESLAVDSNRNEDGTPVRCRTDYNINIWEIPATIEQIEKQIQQSAPIQWFAIREHALKTMNALSIVEEHIGKDKQFTHVPEEPMKQEFTDEEIEEMIKNL